MKHFPPLAMISSAIALHAAGATFHRKDADPIELLTKSFSEHSTELLKRLGATDEQITGMSARLTEIEQKSVRAPGGGFTVPETWGHSVARSLQNEAKSINSNWKGRHRFAVKSTATITSATADAAGSAGAASPADFQTGIIPLKRRKLRMRDLFAPGQTSKGSIEWPRQKARSNNAATVAEGTTKPQSDLQLELVTWPVRTIAHWMLASKQILDDAPAIKSIIDDELIYGLKDIEDQQLLSGGGTGTDLTGVYVTASAYAPPIVPTGAGQITKIDVILLAIAQVEAADYEADGIVLNPLDWRDIMLIKDDIDNYLAGSPFSFTEAQVARLWQMPVVTTKSMAVDNFMVGAHRQGAQIFDRDEANVELSTEDSDNFRKNLVTLLGEERLAFVVKHPDAFVKGSFTTALGL